MVLDLAPVIVESVLIGLAGVVAVVAIWIATYIFTWSWLKHSTYAKIMARLGVVGSTAPMTGGGGGALDDPSVYQSASSALAGPVQSERTTYAFEVERDTDVEEETPHRRKHTKKRERGHAVVVGTATEDEEAAASSERRKKHKGARVIRHATRRADASSSSDSDSESSSSESESKSGAGKASVAIRHHPKMPMITEHRTREMRNFHRTVIAAGVSVTLVIVVLFHLSVLADVTLILRVSDSVAVNPWRWLIELALTTYISYAFVGMVHHYHMVSQCVLGICGAISRVTLGLALLVAPFSAYFWGLVAVAMFFAVLSFVLIWRHAVRGVAWPYKWRIPERAAMLYVPFVAAVHFVFFFASYEVAGWFSYAWTIMAWAIADFVLLVIPGVLFLTDFYYKSSKTWPLFPRLTYAELGLEFYWHAEAQPERWQYHRELDYVRSHLSAAAAVSSASEVTATSSSSAQSEGALPSSGAGKATSLSVLTAVPGTDARTRF
jgi:hypothetical protein